MQQSPIIVLAFDYGETHIGVAVGQSLTLSATELDVLKAKNGSPHWHDVGHLIKTWQPNRLVVGLPLNMDGSESDTSAKARVFARRLQGRFALPVDMMDERLSSFEARGAIIEHKGSRDFKQHAIDSLAAKFILESWFKSKL